MGFVGHDVDLLGGLSGLNNPKIGIAHVIKVCIDLRKGRELAQKDRSKAQKAKARFRTSSAVRRTPVALKLVL